ncbi:hypothetical protein GA0070216_11913 [Micromonospora matsumotoense]|uniref:Uncharacterized protein n=1 Tax=Micromonospora matsumotoense TaxID=121616 RepID=A0A1C5AKZ9_9ACTN|nr:hypothetical protein [Micromonospora matsumotoense]SCF45905.1 hypothetical protein GA0070216_11913 [Micromonospora matsumotoense]
MNTDRETVEVDPALFRAVYDSPASLPGRHRWTTPEHDVRRLEKLLGMPAQSIGAPLWVSGDEPDCPKCGRRTTWLDIVASALKGVHDPAMIATVILGDRRYVNTEVPDAIAGVHCLDCHTPITGLRSFKCHNWAYAFEELAVVRERMRGGSGPTGRPPAGR